MQVGRRAPPSRGAGTFETPNKAELLKVGLGLQDQRDRVKAGEVAMAARAGPTQPLALRDRQTPDRWMQSGVGPVGPTY